MYLSLRATAEFVYNYLCLTSSPMMIRNVLACFMQRNETKKNAGSHSSLLTLEYFVEFVGNISSKLQTII